MELQVGLSRSFRPDVFCKKGVLKNFITFTGKYTCQSLFFNNVTGLSHRFFCWFCKYFKNTFFTEHLRATVSLMWSLHNSFLFILIFLKAPLFVLSFFLAILLMSFVIVLPILMILLCSLNNIEIQFATTTRVGFWTWIWPTRHCDNMVIMLMILLSTLFVIGLLICDNKCIWLLNFNLINEKLWNGALCT